MYSELSATHRLYASSVRAGVDPETLTTEWSPVTPGDSIQVELEQLIQSALNEWVVDTLHP